MRIPYCLPDDEAFVDRFQTSAARMTEIWSKILQDTYARGELFTLQLHPERIDFFREALRSLLRDARSRERGVWIATLDEIARWGGMSDVERETIISALGERRKNLDVPEIAVPPLA